MQGSLLKIGFVPLIDAAPLIAAWEQGYFREEGLQVSLHRQIGWANIRDKLSYGQLDAGHALLGMPIASHLGRDSFSEPLVALMALGAGGNAITIRKALYDQGASSAASLATLMKSQPRFSRPVVGHVFPSSMHHYLLREWLSSAGIDPDRDVKMCIIPPPQMTDHMRGGYVDLFCVGEPWNTLATRQGHGVPIVATTDILPQHPEKVLAVSKRFLEGKGDLLASLVRATLRGCLWCEAPANRKTLAEMLSGEKYLAQPRELLEESLSIDSTFGCSKQQKNARPRNWTLRSFSVDETFPNKMHPAWMLRQMIRWGHLHGQADIRGIAERCVETRPYREAAASLGIDCPPEDFQAMPLRHNRSFTLDDPVETNRKAPAAGSIFAEANSRANQAVAQTKVIL
ncbi:MAG: CmpA/NrtA family ABC transporter substrate-binding protein [Phycisphaerae bacterium]